MSIAIDFYIDDGYFHSITVPYTPTVTCLATLFDYSSCSPSF